MPRQLTTEEFIDKSKQIHSDRYDYSLTIYQSSCDRVKIICPIHGAFNQTPKQHYKGRGCPECGNAQSGISQRLTTRQFIDKAGLVHNNIYDYSLVAYERYNTKVNIICSLHGAFEQRPDKHIQGQGCPICRYTKSANSKRKTTKQFIDKAGLVHNNIYDYSLVDYKGTSTKVKIICSSHGVFEQIPLNHLRTQGCPKCKIVNMTSDTDQFVDKAISVHNNIYDYSLVDYKNSKTKVKIICSSHGVFEQKPNNHLNGQRCPDCFMKQSQQEIDLQEWLKQYIDIEINDRSLIHPLELDILIPSKKIAIEYNGIYWHSEQRGRDKQYHLLKHLLCKERGYRLIQVWENEWLTKKDIVKSIILSSIGIYNRKIGARKCNIKDVHIVMARDFYDNNHIQGFKGGDHRGLFYNGELISLMTIKSNMLERYANKTNTLIHGAFSKILRSFDIKDDITTFSDLRYFTGNVYRTNGFIHQYETNPNYWYFKGNDVKLYSRMQFQKHRLQSKLEVFDPTLTEYQNMLNNGYDRIWDCGNMKFIKPKVLC